jgi:hypothetical protein
MVQSMVFLWHHALPSCKQSLREQRFRQAKRYDTHGLNLISSVTRVFRCIVPSVCVEIAKGPTSSRLFTCHSPLLAIRASLRLSQVPFPELQNPKGSLSPNIQLAQAFEKEPFSIPYKTVPHIGRLILTSICSHKGNGSVPVWSQPCVNSKTRCLFRPLIRPL